MGSLKSDNVPFVALRSSASDLTTGEIESSFNQKWEQVGKKGKMIIFYVYL